MTQTRNDPVRSDVAIGRNTAAILLAFAVLLSLQALARPAAAGVLSAKPAVAIEESYGPGDIRPAGHTYRKGFGFHPRFAFKHGHGWKHRHGFKYGHGYKKGFGFKRHHGLGKRFVFKKRHGFGRGFAHKHGHGFKKGFFFYH